MRFCSTRNCYAHVLAACVLYCRLPLDWAISKHISGPKAEFFSSFLDGICFLLQFELCVALFRAALRDSLQCIMNDGFDPIIKQFPTIFFIDRPASKALRNNRSRAMTSYNYCLSQDSNRCHSQTTFNTGPHTFLKVLCLIAPFLSYLPSGKNSTDEATMFGKRICRKANVIPPRNNK